MVFRRALAEGLRDPHDVAAANKHLAFMHAHIADRRNVKPLSAPHSRRDPSFRLTDAESAIRYGGPCISELPPRQTKATKKS